MTAAPGGGAVDERGTKFAGSRGGYPYQPECLYGHNTISV